jgi:hypothetical protein
VPPAVTPCEEAWVDPRPLQLPPEKTSQVQLGSTLEMRASTPLLDRVFASRAAPPIVGAATIAVALDVAPEVATVARNVGVDLAIEAGNTFVPIGEASILWAAHH